MRADALVPLRGAVVVALLLSSTTVVGQDTAQEHLGTVRQPLVGGAPADEATQESYGLLSLNGNCSASLLRNEWAVTAANCVEGKACGLGTRAEPKPAGYSAWRWVANTTRIGDAPVSLVADEIDRYLGALMPEPSQFIGTFSNSNAVLQPMWVYAIASDGRLL